MTGPEIYDWIDSFAPDTTDDDKEGVAINYDVSFSRCAELVKTIAQEGSLNPVISWNRILFLTANGEREFGDFKELSISMAHNSMKDPNEYSIYIKPRESDIYLKRTVLPGEEIEASTWLFNLLKHGFKNSRYLKLYDNPQDKVLEKEYYIAGELPEPLPTADWNYESGGMIMCENSMDVTARWEYKGHGLGRWLYRAFERVKNENSITSENVFVTAWSDKFEEVVTAREWQRFIKRMLK